MRGLVEDVQTRTAPYGRGPAPRLSRKGGGRRDPVEEVRRAPVAPRLGSVPGRPLPKAPRSGRPDPTRALSPTPPPPASFGRRRFSACPPREWGGAQDARPAPPRLRRPALVARGGTAQSTAPSALAGSCLCSRAPRSPGPPWGEGRAAGGAGGRATRRDRARPEAKEGPDFPRGRSRSARAASRYGWRGGEG